MEPLDASGSEKAQRAFEVNGPEDVTFRVEFELVPTPEEACDLYVDVVGGDARHFTYELRNGDIDRDDLQRVTQAVDSFLLTEIEQRRLQTPGPQPSLSDLSPHVSLLILDEEGTIQDLTRGTRHALGRSPEEPIEPCFFHTSTDKISDGLCGISPPWRPTGSSAPGGSCACAPGMAAPNRGNGAR